MSHLNFVKANLRFCMTAVSVLMLALWTAPAVFGAGPAYRLEVAGLACPFCAYGIEKKLSSLEGVDKVATHIKEGAVVVTVEEGAALDEGRAKKAVEDAGFTLQRFERMHHPAED